MRRLSLALLALSLPAADLAAQRVRPVLPPGRATTPERPAEKPPLAPSLHDPRLYSRYALSRFSAETYPMLSFLQASGLVADGVTSDYLMFGDGTHIGFRVAPSLALTADLTSSVLGGPFASGSTEFGFRVKPFTHPRFAPFVDARYGWSYTSNRNSSASMVPIVMVSRGMYGDYLAGWGRGNVIGVGADTRLREQLWLVAELTRAESRMYGRNRINFDTRSYTMTATRLQVGVRYNHGTWMDAPR